MSGGDREEGVIFDALRRSQVKHDRPFVRKSAEFNALAGRMAGIRSKYSISDADWNLLAGDWIALMNLLSSKEHRIRT